MHNVLSLADLGGEYGGKLRGRRVAVRHRQRWEQLVFGGEDAVVVHPREMMRAQLPHGGPVVHIRVQEAVAKGHHATRLPKSHDSGGPTAHPWVAVVGESTVVAAVGHVEVAGCRDEWGFVREVEEIGHPNDLL